MKLKLEFLGGGIQDLTYDGKQMVAQCPCEGNNYQFSVMVMMGITALTACILRCAQGPLVLATVIWGDIKPTCSSADAKVGRFARANGAAPIFVWLFQFSSRCRCNPQHNWVYDRTKDLQIACNFDSHRQLDDSGLKSQGSMTVLSLYFSRLQNARSQNNINSVMYSPTKRTSYTEIG